MNTTPCDEIIYDEECHPCACGRVDSSIVYGENTHLVFLSGMKYIDAGKVFPVNAIPPGETLSTTVYSADQIIYHGGYWYTNAIRQTRTRVLIGIEYDGEMYFCSIESDLVNS